MRDGPADALAQVLRLAHQRAYYRKHWGIANVDDVLRLASEDRLSELPPIRKLDLRDHYDELIDHSDARDLCSSSGTTGRPIDIPVSGPELDCRVMRSRLSLRELGVTAGTRVLELLSLNDMYTLGPLVWLGTMAEAACAIRCDPARVDRILKIIEHARPEVVLGNPFTMIKLAEAAGDRWPGPGRVPSRAMLAVAKTFEPDLSPAVVAKRACALWGLTLQLNQYGCSELGPIAFECAAHQGLHVYDDVHLVELVDPATGTTVTDPDASGELVVTALTSPRGFLPVRYAVGDIVAWLRRDRCACGRTTPRLGPVIGRRAHLLKVVGQTVFPDAVLDIVDQCRGVRRAALRAHTSSLGGDAVVVLIVVDPACAPEDVRGEVSNRLAANLAVQPDCELVSDEELTVLEQSAGATKTPRFFDRRTAGNVA